MLVELWPEHKHTLLCPAADQLLLTGYQSTWQAVVAWDVEVWDEVDAVEYQAFGGHFG